jgi:hypothetical protein
VIALEEERGISLAKYTTSLKMSEDFGFSFQIVLD